MTYIILYYVIYVCIMNIDCQIYSIVIPYSHSTSPPVLHPTSVPLPILRKYNILYTCVCASMCVYVCVFCVWAHITFFLSDSHIKPEFNLRSFFFFYGPYCFSVDILLYIRNMFSKFSTNIESVHTSSRLNDYYHFKKG